MDLLARKVESKPVRAALLAQGKAVLAGDGSGRLRFGAANYDLLGTVLAVTVQELGTPAVDALVAELAKNSDANLRMSMAMALGATTDAKLGERVLSFADCAVVPDPDAAQLAQIAVSSAASHQRLTGETPKVALLSFSTRGSAEHASVTKVREALAIARQLAPSLVIDGELQFDAAYLPAIAASKAPDSAVAERPWRPPRPTPWDARVGTSARRHVIRQRLPEAATRARRPARR